MPVHLSTARPPRTQFAVGCGHPHHTESLLPQRQGARDRRSRTARKRAARRLASPLLIAATMSSYKDSIVLGAAAVMTLAGCMADWPADDEETADTDETSEEVDTASSEIMMQLLPEVGFGNATSCWNGPNICEKKKMLVGGCDNRNPCPTTFECWRAPWQSVGD